MLYLDYNLYRLNILRSSFYKPTNLTAYLKNYAFALSAPLFLCSLTLLLFYYLSKLTHGPTLHVLVPIVPDVPTFLRNSFPTNQIFIVSLCSVHLHTRLHTGTEQTDLPTSKPPALHLYPSTSHLLTNWPSFSALVLPACLPTNNQPTAFPLYLL